jgi:murein DD-endopeptidase MepM/ murein hydrolase activator NlpD
VRPGDTGIAIARAQGVRWSDVVSLNKLEPPYLLRVGERLLLPPRTRAAATPSPSKISPGAGRAVRRETSIEARARAFNLDMETLITGSEPAARSAPPSEPASASAAIAGAPVFRWPVDGRTIASFGPKPAGRFNDGINVKAGAGSPVRAAADGTVAYAGDAITGFGNLVLIRHDGGWVTAYGHNETLLVKRGTAVKAGEPIARVGSTGAVSEPQLHFEIRRGRTALDPAKLLPPR